MKLEALSEIVADRRLNWTLQILLILSISYLAVQAPINNWDALGYIGCATSSSTLDPHSIHDSAYGALSGVPQFKELTATGDEVSDWYGNPYHFSEKLPYYSVKALFVLAIRGLHGLGVRWALTGPAVSGIAYVAIGILVILWLSRYVTGYKATLALLGVMTTPTLAETVRLFTPDLLSCALAVFALWLILEQRQHWWGMSVALLTVWTRPDYLLFVGILAVALWLVQRLTLAQAVILTGLAFGSYVCLAHFSGNYGWFVLFQDSFVTTLKAPGEFVVNAGTVLRSYPHVLFRAIESGLLQNFLVMYYALGGILLVGGLRRDYQAVLAATLLFGIAHVLIFPSFENRFFGPVIIMVWMSLITLLLEHETRLGDWKLFRWKIAASPDKVTEPDSTVA